MLHNFHNRKIEPVHNFPALISTSFKLLRKCECFNWLYECSSYYSFSSGYDSSNISCLSLNWEIEKCWELGSVICFNKSSKWFWFIMKLENQWTIAKKNQLKWLRSSSSSKIHHKEKIHCYMMTVFKKIQLIHCANHSENLHPDRANKQQWCRPNGIIYLWHFRIW